MMLKKNVKFYKRCRGNMVLKHLKYVDLDQLPQLKLSPAG